MSSPLFRKEAIQHQQDQLLGSVLLTQSLATWLLSALLVIFILVLGAFLALGSYSRKETVQGFIIPSHGLVHVTVEQPTHIKSVFVKDAVYIEANQPIFSVEPPGQYQNGQAFNDRQLHSTKQKQHILKAKLQRLVSLQAQEERALVLENEQIELSLASGKRQLTLLAQILQSRSEELERATTLFNDQLISEQQFDQASQQVLRQQQEVEQLHQQLGQWQIDLSQNQLKQRALPGQFRSQQEDLSWQLEDLNVEAARLHHHQQFTVTASQKGHLIDIRVGPGERVVPGQTLATIIPHESQLQAHLLVPTQAAGFIALEQEVQLRYGAFPFQKFGVYKGQVTHVGQTVLLPVEQTHLPVQLSGPAYLVTVSLQSPTVRAYQQEFSLKPGMLLEADITLGKRSLLEWLLEPIFSLRGRL